MLAVATVGNRLVAAGERGIVLLSDDGGASWRQARVPVSVSLTALQFVDGRTGRVRGEGTGQSWGQVTQLLARATGDPAYVGAAPLPGKPRRDADVEAEVDRELMAAGILPGDPRLYQ